MPAAADLMSQIPPGVDPQEYLDAMRQEMVSGALTQGALTPPHVENFGRQAARMSPLQPLMKLAEAMMARKAMDRSMATQGNVYAKMLQAFQPGGQPAGTASVQVPQSPQTGEGTVLAPGAQAPDHTTVQAPAFTGPNQLNPQGLPPQLMARLYHDPKAFYEAVAGTPEWQTLMRATGGNQALAMQMYLRKVAKEGTVEGRPGNLLSGPFGDTLVPNAEQGVQYQKLPDGRWAAIPVPNAQEIGARGKFLTTEAERAATPEYKPTGPAGTPQAIYPPTPQMPENLRYLDSLGGAGAPGGGSAGGPPPGGAAPGAPQASTGSKYFPPAAAGGGGHDLTSEAQQELLRKGSEKGINYQSELAQNSTGAVGVLRSLREMENLSKIASPSASTPARGALAAMAIASGVDPADAAKFFGVDPAAIQAANKQVNTLAVAKIHSFTSRGTNFDLATFIAANPNLGMTPQGFHRVVDYMRKEAQDAIEMQRHFEVWKKGQQPWEWEGGHTAAWNDLMTKRIAAGKTSSRAPLDTALIPDQPRS